jgi:hypothetical protein
MGETEREEVNGCSDVPIPSAMPCCDYVRPAVNSIKAKQDTHGNWLVEVNGDGVWRGAELDTDNGSLVFSY